MTAKMTTMSERNPESIVVKEGVRAPRLGQIADGLVTAVAVSLPWSTSASSILIVLWLIALVPTLDAASVRRGEDGEGDSPLGNVKRSADAAAIDAPLLRNR